MPVHTDLKRKEEKDTNQAADESIFVTKLCLK